MAKADIRASSKGISTSADRESGSAANWERRTRKRLSAERSLRTAPGARAMVSHRLDPGGKMGSSGEHYARWIREMGNPKQRFFKGKTPGRELLTGTTGRALGPQPLRRCCHADRDGSRDDRPGPLRRLLRQLSGQQPRPG